MNDTFYIIKDWLELLSYIATILGVISIIIAIVVLIKNKPRKNTFRADFQTIIACHTYDGILFTNTINFENFTDKTFSVTSVLLSINNTDYIIEIPSTIKGQTTEALKNIYFAPHESITIQKCFITLPDNLVVTSAVLKVKTTVGNFGYSVNTRQISDCIQKA